MSTPAAGGVRPRRSVLYAPGANARALEKARDLASDALILDLEDAVAPEAKEQARERVCGLTGDYGSREVTIRANGIGTRWHADDLQAIATSGAAAVVVPKVGSGADVRSVADALAAAGAPDTMAVWPMIETPAAVLRTEEIALASPRVAVLVLGVNDLANDLRAQVGHDRAAVLPALAMAVLGARAAGVDVVDGVYNDVRDLDGFEAEARQGRALGFDGKTLVHPSQVDPANRVFAPGTDELEHAREVIAAWQEALAEGRGVATVRGRMIENLHAAEAERLLAYDAAVRALHGTAAPRPAAGRPRTSEAGT